MTSRSAWYVSCWDPPRCSATSRSWRGRRPSPRRSWARAVRPGRSPAQGRTGAVLRPARPVLGLTADLGAAQPLLAVVDGHWCDEPSLRFLAYLVRRLDGLPVALLVATRSTAANAQRVLLDLLAAEPLAVTARPRPLGRPWRGHARPRGTESARTDVHCRLVTGGNPFLLVELLAELGAAGVAARAAEVDRIAAVVVPRGVQRAVLARLRGLPGSAAELARAVAVLGDGADPRRGARLVGLGETGLGE